MEISIAGCPIDDGVERIVVYLLLGAMIENKYSMLVDG